MDKTTDQRIADFHAHLDICSQCRNHPFDLCSTGAKLLKEAAEGATVQEYEFRVVAHSTLPGKQAVECWRAGVFVAGIYPHQDGIRIVSKYMTDVSKEPEPGFARGEWLPAAIVKLGEKPAF